MTVKSPIETWCFALVVVRKEDRFLVVQETKHGQLWYLPAGRVEPGEDFFQTAVRETMEEAGVPITLEGIARIEHSPRPDGSARMRVLFVASPSDDTPPKSEPDAESLCARWVTLEELETLPTRGKHFIDLFRHIHNGGPIYPLSLLTPEGFPL